MWETFVLALVSGVCLWKIRALERRIDRLHWELTEARQLIIQSEEQVDLLSQRLEEISGAATRVPPPPPEASRQESWEDLAADIEAIGRNIERDLISRTRGR